MIKDLDARASPNPDDLETTRYNELYEDPYSPEQYHGIAEHLGVPVEDFYFRLRYAAAAFCLGDGWRFSKSTKKEAFEKVEGCIYKLFNALQDPAFLLNVRRGDLVVNSEMLQAMAEKIERAREDAAKSEKAPRQSREEFVDELADIYERTTKRIATRTINPITHKPEGPFWDFTKLCIEPLDPSAIAGLDHVIRKVCAERRAKTVRP